MTVIDGINRMLRYIGELPLPSSVAIDSLNDGHEAKTARTVLEETLREEQEEKWWFNTFTISYVPDTDGYITLPQNVIAYEGGDVIIEGGNLYTVATMSPIFTDPVELVVRLELAFDTVPDIFRTYVILVAAKHLHIYLNGDETTQKALSTKVNLQRIKVEREHLKQSKFNLISGTRVVDRGTNPSAL